MSKLDDAQPRLVPPGVYRLTISAEPTRESSQFKSGDYYWRFPFIAKDGKGRHFELTQAFKSTKAKDAYHQLLIALGGKDGEEGWTISPSLDTKDLIGKVVTGEVIQREAKNEKGKMVNEIINIRPLSEIPEELTEPLKSEKADEAEEVEQE